MLLNEDKRSASEPSSPFLSSINTNFQSDSSGIIRLPPLSSTLGIVRPQSAESSLRHTANNSRWNPLPTPDSDAELESKKEKEFLSNLIPTQSFELPSGKLTSDPTTPTIKKKGKRTTSRKNDMSTPLSVVKSTITPSAHDKKRAFAFITHSKDSFGVKEPKIDNAPLARRKRRRTSSHELSILQAEFEKCSTPSKQVRLELAKRCSMTDKAVQIWFQNKRQSMKRVKKAATGTTAAVTPPESTTTETNSLTPPRTILALSHAKKYIDTHATPLAPKSINIRSDDNENDEVMLKLPAPQHTTPTRKTTSNSNSSRENTPTRRFSPTSKKSQALTFHLKTDKKILTPVKTSPNNRVNRLINGTGKINVSPSKNNNNNMSKLEFKSEKMPLQEIERNTMNL